MSDSSRGGLLDGEDNYWKNSLNSAFEAQNRKIEELGGDLDLNFNSQNSKCYLKMLFEVGHVQRSSGLSGDVMLRFD